MGILNINDDSFSGDGVTDPRLALDYARKMVAQGADIVDVGGESARTNRGPISEEEEIQRLLPFVQNFGSVMENSERHPLLSINTWRPAVTRAILACGGHILNDIGALPTAENARICAEYGVALVIMHSVGEPKVPHRHVRHIHILNSLRNFFEEKIRWAEQAGMKRTSIILDPGIDFAKQDNDNLTIYRELEVLHAFRLPLLLPVSRKHVIGSVLNIAQPNQRDAGTVACIVSGILRGASIFRVHNVPATLQAIEIVHRLCVASEAA
jgi:dihydropteroate synthase